MNAKSKADLAAPLETDAACLSVGDAGDIYVGFDRFGRACDIRWQTPEGEDVERIQYGFDRNSRRTWRRRTMTPLWDHAYNYDSLSQVTVEDRGDINSNHTAIAGAPATHADWTYDETGNWAVYQTGANGNPMLHQTRVHDKGNRLMQVSGAAQMETDPAGRMTQVPKPGTVWNESRQIKWDAWSRIVQVREGETVLADYQYDGLTRRTRTIIDSTPRETYYNDAWKPVEDGGYLYYWGARHRDDLIRRDDAESNSHTVLMDYFSPAAIADNNGDVVERYDFSAFGLRTLLAANFDPIVISSVGFTFAFQGQFEDPETGWLNYGYRYYLPNLGRFACKDPIMEAGGSDLYVMAHNSPVNQVDLLGLGPPGVAYTREIPPIRPDNLDDPAPDLGNPEWAALTDIQKYVGGGKGNNCYNYAMCTPSGGMYPSNTLPGQFNAPGYPYGTIPSGSTGTTVTDDHVVKGIKEDTKNDTRSPNGDGSCPPGYYKVRTWFSASKNDWHVMREANDGRWYHKPDKSNAAQRANPNYHRGYTQGQDICVPCKKKGGGL